MKEIQILVVDDHPVVRAGIRGMLSSQADMRVVGEAGEGKAALDLVNRHVPDVVLLDLRMPEFGGLWFIEQMSRLEMPARVLVLTTYDTDAEVFKAIEAGATGYLLKDCPRETLFSAIRAAATGEATLAPKVAAKLMAKVRATGAEALSLREIEVLQKVARGATNREIARQLRISEATVKSHLIHVYSKLDVSDRTSAVTRALELGIFALGE